MPNFGASEDFEVERTGCPDIRAGVKLLEQEGFIRSLSTQIMSSTFLSIHGKLMLASLYWASDMVRFPIDLFSSLYITSIVDQPNGQFHDGMPQRLFQTLSTTLSAPRGQNASESVVPKQGELT